MSNNSFFYLNYYQVLEINDDASLKEIKDAYFKLFKKYHPDVCKDPDATEKFKYLNEAYQVLIDQFQRIKYDIFLVNKQKNNKAINNNFTPNKYYFDITEFNAFIKYPFYKNIFIKFLQQLNLEQAYLLYEYFWLSFWLNKQLTLKILTNKIIIKIYECFHENETLHKSRKILNINQKLNKDNKPFYARKLNEFKNVLNDIYNDLLKENDMINLESIFNRYNHLIDDMNQTNLFYDENMILYSLFFSQEIKNIFNLMSNIFDIYKRKK